jgi:hypothetical protein
MDYLSAFPAMYLSAGAFSPKTDQSLTGAWGYGEADPAATSGTR